MLAITVIFILDKNTCGVRDIELDLLLLLGML